MSFSNISLEKIKQQIREMIEKSDSIHDCNTVLVSFNFQFDSAELYMYVSKPTLIELVKIPSSSDLLTLFYDVSEDEFYPLSVFKKLQLIIKMIQMDLHQNIDILNAFTKCIIGIRFDNIINSSEPETYEIVRIMYAVYKKRLNDIKRIKEVVDNAANEITNRFSGHTKRL